MVEMEKDWRPEEGSMLFCQGQKMQNNEEWNNNKMF